MPLCLRNKVRFLIAFLFIFTGILHFTLTDKFVQIIPSFIPAPLEVVYASGVIEILGAIGLLIPKYKRKAAFGLILLLIAVFPANIYMAIENIQLGGILNNQFLQWVRLPFQFVLMWLLYWCSE